MRFEDSVVISVWYPSIYVVGQVANRRFKNGGFETGSSFNSTTIIDRKYARDLNLGFRVRLDEWYYCREVKTTSGLQAILYIIFE
jgi:hypothetical protein